MEFLYCDMLLLCIDAGMLFVITISLGILFQLGLEKFMRVAIRPDLIGTFLAGLILSTVYFNLVSFCFPVNYWTLLPTSGGQYLSLPPFRRSLSCPVLFGNPPGARDKALAAALSLPWPSFISLWDKTAHQSG